MKKTTYSCDLCHRDFDHSDKYIPDSTANGLGLLTSMSTWQRLLLDSEDTIDICINCCKTIAHLIDVGVVYPIKVELNIADDGKKTNIKGAICTVQENDIRAKLKLRPNNFSPAEIIIWGKK